LDVTVLLVALGAALGAVLRYLAAHVLHSREGAAFPYGTLLVNVAGSLLLALVASMLAAGDVGAETMALVGTGFCGALTTYSTFAYETVGLAERGARRLALVNIVVSVMVGLGAAALGWRPGTML